MVEQEVIIMDSKALEKAFHIYQDVKLVVVDHLYETPAWIDEIVDRGLCLPSDMKMTEEVQEAITTII